MAILPLVLEVLQGRGLGNSIQKMGYLPEPQTDVIMAIISEELGLLGAIIVIGGLGFIVLRALSIALTGKRSSCANACGRNWKYDWNSNIC